MIHFDAKKKKSIIFCFEFELKAKPFGSLFFIEEQKTRVRDVFLTLPHLPALFVTSLIYTAWHKMAELTVVFSPLSNVDLISRFCCCCWNSFVDLIFLISTTAKQNITTRSVIFIQAMG